MINSEIQSSVGTITFNDPDRRNCLSVGLINELSAALDRFEEAGVRVVILRAMPGVKVWSSGYDVNELSQPGRDPLPYEAPFEFLLRRVQAYPNPVIAMIEGSVWGGACDLAFTCDILIGCETASFAITPARLGIPYATSGMIHFINMVGLNKAKEMFFTAAPIGASEALATGILNHLVPAAELQKYTYEIATRILQNAPLAVKAFKEQFRLLSKGHSIDAETAEKIQSVRRLVYSSRDYEEGIKAFKEKRSPLYRGK